MKKIMGSTKKVTEESINLVVANEQLSKSGKMKQLFDMGLEVKDIAKRLNVRYNFVYNVVSNMVIVNGYKVENVHQDSKKDKVYGLFDQGKTVKEVAIELKSNMQYIYKLHKEWAAEAKQEVEKMDQAAADSTK